MSRARRPEAIRLRSARMLDVVKGELLEPGDVLVVGERIAELQPVTVPDGTVTIDLGDLTLVPGLMDMEV
ncbi:MAG TPA: hypothetical protein VE991_13635, partial [Acidimicrobiales bacterium]|nr:hypothetical protein [Acidimicrobiales bacterium]